LVTKKKRQTVFKFDDRKLIIENLNFVNEVLGFEDDKQGSCINGLKIIKQRFPKDEILFTNGGDRTAKNIPEMTLDGINFIFGVGGDKKLNSSSKILKDWVDFFTKN
jgi:hypothetical protein